MAKPNVDTLTRQLNRKSLTIALLESDTIITLSAQYSIMTITPNENGTYAERLAANFLRDIKIAKEREISEIQNTIALLQNNLQP